MQVDGNIFKRHLTFLQFFEGKPGVYYGYAPAADKNKPDVYAQFVVTFLKRQLSYPVERVPFKQLQAITVNTLIESLVQQSGVKAA